MQYFRDSGYKIPLKRAHQSGGSSNNLISAPGVGKQIVIYDTIVMSESGDEQVIRDGSSGTILTSLPAGHVGFVCPIGIGENKPLWIALRGDNSTTYATTVTYSIEPV